MTDNLAIVQEHYESLNRHDLDRFVAIAHEDCQIVDVPSGRVLKGREGYRAYAGEWLRSFPDLRIEPTSQLATGDFVAVEGHARGTNTGPLPGPGGDVPPTLRRLDLAFCDVFELREGKIAANRVYYDSGAFARQLALGLG